MEIQDSDITRNNTSATGLPRGTKNVTGQKRTRKEVEPKEERQKKYVKVDNDASDKPVKVSIKRGPKAKKGQAQSAYAISKGNSTTFIEPKWNVLRSNGTRKRVEATQTQEQPPLTDLKPRIWTSSRQELVVLLPDLAGPKCLNGVSWLMYETPMVLLDESTTCFDISLQDDSVTLDLLTTREFICAWPPIPEKAPENLTVNSVPDGNCLDPGVTVTSSSSKKLPKTRRIMKSTSTTATAPATGSTNPTQTQPEAATSIDVPIPSPTYTPHKPSTTIFKTTGSEQESSEKLIDVIAPSSPTYIQGKPSVKGVSELYGSSTRVPSGPFHDVSMGRRRTKATESTKETPDGVLIDFSPPSIPTYTVYKPISESLRNADSDGEVGKTATKQMGSSYSVHPQDPTLKSREEIHSTNAFMTTDPLQIRKAVNCCRNIPIPTPILGCQYQWRDNSQAELVKNQPPVLGTSNWSRKHSSLIIPSVPGEVRYETKYTVTTNASYTTSADMDNLLTQAIQTFDIQHSPTYDHEPDNFKSSTCSAVLPVNEVVSAQLSFVDDADPAPQLQNASIAGMALSVTNNRIADTNGQIESDFNKLYSLAPHSAGVPDPAGRTHAGSKKHETSQLEPRTKITTGKHSGATHIDIQVDCKPESEPRATEAVESTNCTSGEAQVEQVRNMMALQDVFIPSTIPKEIQAIIDSYLSGRPLLLVISNKRFFDYWSLLLPEEFGFLMLGYFRILGVQESRVQLNEPVNPLTGSMTGRVKWRFRLRWSPGGEEWILPKHDKQFLEYPWWKPPPPPPPIPPLVLSLDAESTDNMIINHAASAISQEILAAQPFTPPPAVSNFVDDKDRIASFEPESTFDTTLRYRVARLSNVNYEFRHVHLRDIYHSHVPLQLLAPYGRTVLDSSFPLGWLCEICGKMNFQAALRHRICSSSFCKDVKPEIAPYAIELIFMRDPQDNLSMVLPYNEPLLIDLVDTWEDGTRTLPYYIRDDENIFIKHIFTGNLPQLQLEATRLLHFIQVEVELIRPIGEKSPYFQYSAHAPKDDPSPTTSEWPNVPLCMHHAKDWTQHQAIWFGEVKSDHLSFNHLCLLAWVTSGTKRGPETIRAKEKCVVFHAFGCNITVLVTPLSSKATATVKVTEADLDCLITMEDIPPDEPDVNPGWIVGLEEEDDAIDDPWQEETERWPATNLKMSNSNRPFLFTLVHGDVLVFYGDDFEYSLKRAGTSFLLIASHQNDEVVPK